MDDGRCKMDDVGWTMYDVGWTMYDVGWEKERRPHDGEVSFVL